MKCIYVEMRQASKNNNSFFRFKLKIRFVRYLMMRIKSDERKRFGTFVGFHVYRDIRGWRDTL